MILRNWWLRGWGFEQGKSKKDKGKSERREDFSPQGRYGR